MCVSFSRYRFQAEDLYSSREKDQTTDMVSGWLGLVNGWLGQTSGELSSEHLGTIPIVSYLTLYQPMTHICIMSSHKPIRIYMGGLILGVTLYRLFCFFKLFPMVGKGLIGEVS